MDLNFSDERVNTGRQVELDIAKGMAIVFMVFMYSIMVVSLFPNSLSEGYTFVFSNLLGRLGAAPVIMFCMGVGMVYSTKSSSERMIRRGINLMILGVLVNLLQFFLPCLVTGILLGEWTIFPIAKGLMLFRVDFLAFAGMTFILMGFAQRLDLTSGALITFALFFSVVGSTLRFSDLNYSILNLIAGYFIGTEGGFTSFPLFTWFIIPAVGYAWGDNYSKVKSKDDFFRFWPVLLIVSMAYFLCTLFFKNGFLSDLPHYCFMTTLDAVPCLVFAYGIIGLYYHISKVLPDPVLKLFELLSTKITTIYVALWALIPLGPAFAKFFMKDLVFGELATTVIALGGLCVAVLIAVLDKNRKRRSQRRSRRHRR